MAKGISQMFLCSLVRLDEDFSILKIIPKEERRARRTYERELFEEMCVFLRINIFWFPPTRSFTYLRTGIILPMKKFDTKAGLALSTLKVQYASKKHLRSRHTQKQRSLVLAKHLI